jgi:hypothetical protein
MSSLGRSTTDNVKVPERTPFELFTRACNQGWLTGCAQVGEALFELTTLFGQGLRFLVDQSSTEILTEFIERG